MFFCLSKNKKFTNTQLDFALGFGYAKQQEIVHNYGIVLGTLCTSSSSPDRHYFRAVPRSAVCLVWESVLQRLPITPLSQSRVCCRAQAVGFCWRGAHRRCCYIAIHSCLCFVCGLPKTMTSCLEFQKKIFISIFLFQLFFQLIEKLFIYRRFGILILSFF